MELNNDNDDASVESSGPYDPAYINDETLELLKENDKYTDSLRVVCNCHYIRFDPLSVDWESEGRAIAENTRLYEIEILDINQTDLYQALDARGKRARIDNAKAFYQAVALNRSIGCISIHGNITNGLGMEDVVSILTPFVKENSNLFSVVLGGFDLSAMTAYLLASALSTCTAKLSTFGLKRVTGITATKMSKILDAIGKSPSIEELCLDENETSDEVATVLGGALPSLSSLKSLALGGDIDMEHGNIQHGSITAAGVEAIAAGLNNSSLEGLSFWGNRIGTTGGRILAEALSTNKVLKKLDLTEAVFPRPAEYIQSKSWWETFFELLQTSALTDLSIGGNRILDENIAAFVEYLNAMPLVSLDLGSVGLTTNGWGNFFSGLKGNTSLRTIKLEWPVRNLNVQVILQTLCDKTSIESICNSNHTLAEVGGLFLDPVDDEAESECERLLKMNEGTNKTDVVRGKILEYHFGNGENLQELATMELTLMPNILEWVGRDGIQVGYQLLRSLPSLCSVSAKSVGGKRKRDE